MTDTRFKKGIIPWNKGKKLIQFSGENNPAKRPEVREILRQQKLGKKNPMFGKPCVKAMLGKKHKPETIEKMKSYRGNMRYNYIDSEKTISLEKKRLRATSPWREWREKVFVRDKFICQECDKVGGYLEPHHIKPIKVVGLNSSQLFDITNGITLCRPCHIKTMGKESNFEEKYTSISGSSNVGLLLK